MRCGFGMGFESKEFYKMKAFGLAVKLDISSYKCKVKLFSKRNVERVIKSNVIMTGYLSNRRDYLESRRNDVHI